MKIGSLCATRLHSNRREMSEALTWRRSNSPWSENQPRRVGRHNVLSWSAFLLKSCRALRPVSETQKPSGRIWILTIFEAFSRLSPTIGVWPQYRSTDVVEPLERVTGIHGMPKTIRLDNGPEFISEAPDP